MVDGIDITFHTPNSKSYLLGLPCWEILVNEKTGVRVDDKRTAHIRGLDLKLKPSGKGGYTFLSQGSFHKFHNCGEHNTDQFTFSKFLQAIDSFTDIFGLDTNSCYIHGLEIGINIQLPFSPLKVLKNAVCYQSRPFTQINKKCARKGLQCALSQYSVKVYDKGVQSGFECGNTLRLEVSVSKMQALSKYGITTLADLQNRAKVYPLVNVLYEALEGIVWTDTSVNLKRLTSREQKQWLFYSNPKTWQNLGKYQRYRAAKAWSILFKKYSNPPDLINLVGCTWEALFLQALEADKPQPSYRHDEKTEAHTTATNLHLECTVRMLRSLQEKSNRFTPSFSIIEIFNKNEKQKPPKRFCCSCGNDISHQRKGSLFCSEYLNGKAGKRCRNKNSNNRKNKKLKIHKGVMNNNYLVITYENEAGELFTDTLHPSEVFITKEWLDRVKSITLLPIEKTTTKNNKSHVETIN